MNNNRWKLESLPEGKVFTYLAVEAIDAFLLLKVSENHQTKCRSLILKGDKHLLKRKLHALNLEHGFLGACHDDKPIAKKIIGHFNCLFHSPIRYLKNRVSYSLLYFFRSFS